MRWDEALPRIGRSSPVLALVLSFVLGGCSALTETCTTELEYEPEPRAIILRVGESTAATMYAVSCGGRKRDRVSAAWSVADTAVASVDAATGRVTARGPGDTVVRAAVPSSSVSVPLHVSQ